MGIKEYWNKDDTLNIPATNNRDMITNIGRDKPHKHQDLWPIETPATLIKKLGISKNDNVLVFAGAQGDWADAIRRGISGKLYYTDADPKMVKIAKKKYPKMDCYEESTINLKERNVDWLFSFEPLPLYKHNAGFICAFLYAMIFAKKGLKIYGINQEPPEMDILEQEYEINIDGKRGTKNNIEILADHISAGGNIHINLLTTIKKNKKAENLAIIDRRVLEELQRYSKVCKLKGLGQDKYDLLLSPIFNMLVVKDMIKKLHIDTETLLKSVGRLNRVSRYFGAYSKILTTKGETYDWGMPRYEVPIEEDINKKLLGDIVVKPGKEATTPGVL